MENVLSFSTLKNHPVNLRIGQAGDLAEYVKIATMLRQNAEEFNDTVAVMDFNRLKRVFELRLADLVLQSKNANADLCLCGDYVAALLTEIGKAAPESWYAADYFAKAADENNPTVLKQGANVCFLICSVFPDRSQHRNMMYNNYVVLGKVMYYNYYGKTGAMIAYFMCRRFKSMVAITRECLHKLK